MYSYVCGPEGAPEQINDRLPILSHSCDHGGSSIGFRSMHIHSPCILPCSNNDVRPWGHGWGLSFPCVTELFWSPWKDIFVLSRSIHVNHLPSTPRAHHIYPTITIRPTNCIQLLQPACKQRTLPNQKVRCHFFVFLWNDWCWLCHCWCFVVEGLVTPGDGPCVDEVEFQVSFMVSMNSFSAVRADSGDVWCTCMFFLFVAWHGCWGELDLMMFVMHRTIVLMRLRAQFPMCHGALLLNILGSCLLQTHLWWSLLIPGSRGNDWYGWCQCWPQCQWGWAPSFLRVSTHSLSAVSIQSLWSVCVWVASCCERCFVSVGFRVNHLGHQLLSSLPPVKEYDDC